VPLHSCIRTYLLYRLTEREKLDQMYKKKLYQLASEHDKVIQSCFCVALIIFCVYVQAKELERVDRYFIPSEDIVSCFVFNLHIAYTFSFYYYQYIGMCAYGVSCVIDYYNITMYSKLLCYNRNRQ